MIGDDYLFLDDLTLSDVQKELGVTVVPSGYSAGEFVDNMRNLAAAGTAKSGACIMQESTHWSISGLPGSGRPGWHQGQLEGVAFIRCSSSGLLGAATERVL